LEQELAENLTHGAVLPTDMTVRIESRRTFFGGLYQLLVLIRE